jgi:hypothetical protein
MAVQLLSDGYQLENPPNVAVNKELNRLAVFAILPARTIPMKLTIVRLALALMFITAAGALEGAEAASPGTNSPVSDGWLQLPSHEVVLDVRHKWFEFGARQDACEFLATLITFLTQANYTVRLSDDFIRQEIDYYREYQKQEVPVELSKGLLNCLEQSRASGVLDWDCFKGDFSRGLQNSTRQRHLLWIAPPLKPSALALARPDNTNLACLSLTLEWAGRDSRGAVLYSRGPRAFPGESVLIQGKTKVWAFSAVMRLTKGSETIFEKTYQREEWKKSYSSAFEQPLWKTSEAILQDIKIGLRPKPVPPADTKKSKKRSKST